MSQQMWRELTTAVDAVSDDGSVRVVVIRSRTDVAPVSRHMRKSAAPVRDRLLNNDERRIKGEPQAPGAEHVR